MSNLEAVRMLIRAMGRAPDLAQVYADVMNSGDAV